MAETVHIVLGSPERKLSTYHSIDGKVIGVDGGALLCMEVGLHMDAAIGDFDSITSDDLKRVREEAKIVLQYNAEKDDTDAEIALLKAEELFKPEKIIVHNWAGGRMDHLFNLLFFVHQPRFKEIRKKVIFRNFSNTLQFYEPGSYTVNRETDRTYIAFIGMTPVRELTLSEVKYPLDGGNFDYPVTLTSNEILGDHCRFSFVEGLILVIQSTG